MKNVKEIEFKIENEEWTTLLDKAFKKKVKDVNVDGFRKGACPKDVFIKKFGTASLYEEASNMAIDDAYRKVIENNNRHLNDFHQYVVYQYNPSCFSIGE